MSATCNTRGSIINLYQILFWKSEWRRSVVGPRDRQDNIKTDIREQGAEVWNVFNWDPLGTHWEAFMNRITNIRVS